jgi:hypothetical protein
MSPTRIPPAEPQDPPRTPGGFTTDLISEVRAMFFKALKETGVSADQLAGAIGRDPKVVTGWYSNGNGPPFYLAAHRRVPLPLRLRLVADMLGFAGDADAPRATIETSTAMLTSIAGECLVVAGRVLTDQRVDEGERLELRPLVARLRDRCDRWLREHGGEARLS